MRPKALPRMMTSDTLLPGYWPCSFLFAAAMSDGLNPLMVVPLPPCIRDFGNMNLSPMVTEPSPLNVADVSYPQPAAATMTAAIWKVRATVLGTPIC